VSGDIRFDGDVVIVTGAAGGIGRSQAIELGRRGARVVVNDLGGSPRGGGADPTMAHAVVDEIVSAGGEAVASGASVSSDEGPAQIVEAAMDTWGRIDGLIHNAAIVLDDHFEDVTDDDLDSIMTVNLRGTFRTVRAVYRAMKDTGGGRIVTLTSASGLSGAFGQAAYATSKMGVLGMTRSVAWEGMRFGIKVNALAPAAFDTRSF
jgi:NAD(P)-dependent dehydrogenase (short-subunit alcohol dehydrogenase family)